MDLSFSGQERIEMQFDHFCKTVIANEMRNINKYNSYLLKHEKTFGELSEEEKQKLYSVDEYFSINQTIVGAGFSIEIKNDMLFEAITKLSENRQNIILLSYWLEMTDTEISQCLNLVRRTVSYIRNSSLQQLRKYLEKTQSEASKSAFLDD